MSTTTTHPAISLCDLSVAESPIRDEIRRAMEEVLDARSFILGPQVAELETKVAEFCHARHGVGCSSGSDALLLALMALEIGPGDEVITSPFTFFATAGAIARLGARPVFVDIEPAGFNIDPAAVEKAITPHTRAIIPVHLFGQMADMGRLLPMAVAHKLAIVEDAAQAFGAEYKGSRAGSLGCLGCLSFFPSKNLGCAGDGGMVLTSQDELAERVRVLRGHGAKPKYYHAHIGGNFRLDTLQAAMLLVKLKWIEQWNDARRAAATRYRTLLCERGLQDVLQLPEELPNRHHVYNQFCIRSTAREQLVEELRRQHISTAVYYPLPLHLQPCFAYLGYRAGDLPHSEQIAQEICALPMFPGITAAQQERVVDALSQSLANSPSHL